MFERKFKDELMKKLMNEELYISKLKTDIEGGKVFPAFRNDSIDFYYKGGGLFRYDGIFFTHFKYASVIEVVNGKNYINEMDLKKTKNITNFLDGYDRIKKNCANYSGVEANGVSQIYGKFSYVNSSSNVVVLDIEISFKSLDKNHKQDRIDLLLINKDENKLRFYEAKHFSNKEIWAREHSEPEVVSQVKRYKDQVSHSKDEILKQYSNYIELVNTLFSLNLEKPNDLDTEVVLLIFGFDEDQRDGRFKKLLKEDGSLNEIRHYAMGNEKKINIQNVWDRLK